MTALTLARPEHIDALLRLIGDFHAETGIEQDDATRRAAVEPLLEGSPHGALYLLGPALAPIGYVAIGFGWSIEFGGLDGFLDEIYIRPGVRGRGIGTEVLRALPRTLAQHGLRALHLEVARDAGKTRAIYEKLGFEAREGYMLMSRRF